MLETKNAFSELIGQLDIPKERISDIEDKSAEITQDRKQLVTIFFSFPLKEQPSKSCGVMNSLYLHFSFLQCSGLYLTVTISCTLCHPLIFSLTLFFPKVILFSHVVG